MTTVRPVGLVQIMSEQCTGRGARGLVAAAAPVAARIGAETLAAGGNAYDAALAAALAETVLLPPKCGLAGDLVALAWPRGCARPEALLGVGGAPAALGAVAAHAELTPTGPMSVGVPGAPAGYAAIAERGRLGVRRAAAPAIELAREGFAWSRICTLLTLESADLLRRHNGNGNVYLPSGEPAVPGALMRLSGLANALEHFAADPGGFLDGPVGDAIVGRVQEAGGILASSDMAFAGAVWTEVAATSAALGDYFATPAPTHGPSLLEVVAALPGTGAGAATVYQHVLDAIAARRATLADPSGTSMVSAVDDEGTLVTLVHSNSFPRYGSGLVVSEFDLILANRAGRGFSSEMGHPNFPVAGRRPATTLHAWAVRTPNGRRLQGATPGGANQMPWNAQALAQLQRDPADVGAAVVGPRWEWLPDDDGVRVEEGMSDVDLEELTMAAPTVQPVGRWGLRSAMQIVVDEGPEHSNVAVVDPRTGGAVCAV